MGTIAKRDGRSMPLTISVILIVLVCVIAGGSGLFLTLAPLNLNEQLAGVTYSGLCAITALVALVPYRRRERWSYYALWVFAAVIIAIPALLISSGAPVAMRYFGQAAAVVLALVLGIPAMFGGGR